MPTGLLKAGTHGPGWQGAMILPETSLCYGLPLAQPAAALVWGQLAGQRTRIAGTKRNALFENETISCLFFPQRFQGIDLGGLASRYVAGEECQRCQQQRRADKQARIIRTDTNRVGKNAG